MPIPKQLAPSRATFFSAVASSGGGKSSSKSEKDDNEDDDEEARVLPSLAAFVRNFEPVLREVDEWLTSKGLNDPAKV